jgi:hypothetical protein
MSMRGTHGERLRAPGLGEMSRGHGGKKERDICLPLPGIEILLLDNDDNDSGRARIWNLCIAKHSLGAFIICADFWRTSLILLDLLQVSGNRETFCVE